MHHYPTLKELQSNNAWVTIGSFDGVHLGHQSIIRNMVAGAHSQNAPAIVVTFHPHPAVFLRKIREAYYLTSPEERAWHLSQLGVDDVVTLNFNQELANQTAREFMGMLHRHTHLQQLWVGYDFALGKDRQGNAAYLENLGKELGYTLHAISPITLDGEIVSSSQIRQWVAEGEMEKAARWLGRWYSVEGEVVHGDGRGHHIGIPTANLSIWPLKRMPAPGVYAAFSWLGNSRYPSVLNLGVRPTFEEGITEPRLEVHIPNFSADIYGKTLRLDIVKRLRQERKFSSIDLLLEQIHQDINTAQEVLANVP